VSRAELPPSPLGRRRRHSIRTAAAGLVLTVGIVAGCGGSGQPGASPLPSKTPGGTTTAASRSARLPGLGPQRCAPPFRAGAWPGACWRPFGPRSPFNQKLPAHPRLASGSAELVRGLTAQGGPSPLQLGTARTSSDYDHPVYFAGRHDPVYRVHCTRSEWGRCEIEGQKVRVPPRARPAGGSDHHLAVVDQAAGWEYDLWQVLSMPPRGGVLTASWGGRARAGRLGTGLRSDATAAQFALLAGIVRAPELAAGRVDHALFVRVSCDSGAFVFPAAGRGSRCSDTAAAPPEGTRFQLAMSDREIDALGVPAWKQGILRAMARYGFFVGDTGGSPWDVVLESGASYTSFGRPDPFISMAVRLGAPRGDDGFATLNLASGVDWSRRLRVIDPCVSARTCG
jgi:hypothetical protein